MLRSAALPFDPFAWLPWNFYDVMTHAHVYRALSHTMFHNNNNNDNNNSNNNNNNNNNNK